MKLGPSGLITAPAISYLALAPSLIPMVVAMAILVVSSLVRGRLPSQVWAAMALVGSLASAGTAATLWAQLPGKGFETLSGALIVDGFALGFASVVSLAMAMSTLVIDGWSKREGLVGPELQALGLLSGSGAILMAMAGDLIVIFLGLEIMSIALYVMVAMNRRDEASGEAALKYFLLGAFSSAIFLYGIALTYGSVGTTNLVGVATYLANTVIVSNGVLLAGMVLILVGLGFKIAAVPFHMWAPDVYQGAPTPVTGFMAAVAKAGAFAALIHTLMAAEPSMVLEWQPVVYGLAVVSLVVGSVLTVVQTDVKRMLAYSSISHAGFMLVGLESATSRGVASVVYYMVAYSFMTVGSFAVVSVVAGRGDHAHQLGDFRGLSRRNGFLAASLSVLLLAQAGVPFTTGFLAKLYVVGAAVGSGAVALGLIAMLSAVIAAFFYLRLVLTMYQPAPAKTPQESPYALVGARAAASRSTSYSGGIFEQDGDVTTLRTPPPSAIVIGVCVAVTVILGVWPSPLTSLAHHASLLF